MCRCIPTGPFMQSYGELGEIRIPARSCHNISSRAYNHYGNTVHCGAPSISMLAALIPKKLATSDGDTKSRLLCWIYIGQGAQKAREYSVSVG